LSGQPKKGIEWLSAREISIIAAIGGLELATVLMGLVIPIGPGGYGLWVLEGLLYPACLATGPIGCFLVLAIPGIVRPMAIGNVLAAALFAILGVAFWPMRNWVRWKKMLGVAALFIPWSLLSQFPWVYLYIYYYGFYPLESFWVVTLTSWALVSVPSIIYYVGAAWATLALFPKFIQPTWLDRWRGKA